MNDWSTSFKLSDLYDAFISGAKEMKMNPTASDYIIERTADAYTKGIQMDNEKCEYIRIIEKDILHAYDSIVGHCCNTRNTMNSGVAKALRDRFPEIYIEDRAAYRRYGADLLGKCVIAAVETDKEYTPIKHIANLYGQKNYGYCGDRYINYEGFYQSLEQLRDYTKELKYRTIGLPFKIGSDRAGGHWPIVLEMIKKVFESSELVINLYKI